MARKQKIIRNHFIKKGPADSKGHLLYGPAMTQNLLRQIYAIKKDTGTLDTKSFAYHPNAPRLALQRLQPPARGYNPPLHEAHEKGLFLLAVHYQNRIYAFTYAGDKKAVATEREKLNALIQAASKKPSLFGLTSDDAAIRLFNPKQRNGKMLRPFEIDSDQAMRALKLQQKRRHRIVTRGTSKSGKP